MVVGEKRAAHLGLTDGFRMCLAFHDLSPQAATLFLVMPKEPVIGLSEAEDSGESEEVEEPAHYQQPLFARRVDPDWLPKAMVVDEGPEGGQSVYRIHLRVLGGRQLGWPPG
ncbi:histidine triad nucleotide-binding protein 1-like [Empidonax traillii]|uniref:histidine triad nucleotide-binding protein 1-like n=1 Tax=Empidonax traillii TaxID=164674 RepID=UPI000FFD4293|nr:histidine triad nucleotide-binding protein 1-like [Empidonax traillii]